MNNGFHLNAATIVVLTVVASCSNPGQQALPDAVQRDVATLDTVTPDDVQDWVDEDRQDIVVPFEVQDSIIDFGSTDLTDLVEPGMPEPRLNEIGCHGNDFIELVNLSPDTPADLTGFTISDTGPDNGAYVFDAGTALKPLGRMLIARKTEVSAGFDFGIRCGTDTIVLSDAGGAVVDSVSPGLVMETSTWSRLPDAVGDWSESTFTAGSANLPAPDLNGILFNPFRVASINISLPQASIDSLWSDSTTYVTATFSYTNGDYYEGDLPVGVRIKGKYGSYRNLDGKSALKVKFNFDDKSGRFMGLKKLTLNNMVQDPSMIHEALSYRIFAAMGVPCPRVGYAFVSINDQPYGLYLVLEPYDDVTMARHFPSMSHVYEGEYGIDIVPGQVWSFEIDEGDENTRTDLEALAETAFNSPDDTWLDTMGDVADVDELIRMWAVEQYIGHWDGYAPTINNYYLHSTEDGIFTMLPNGTDQTFVDFRDYHDGYSFLFSKCMNIPACRQKYNVALGQLIPILDNLDLDSFAAELAGVLAPIVASDPRKPYSNDDVVWYVQGARDFMVNRRQHLESVLACLLDENADLDGDGFKCGDDCDETDPLVHRGAYDTCGDGIDQDCNGTPDDAFECPDCKEVFRGPHRYLVCPTWRTYDQAVQHCEEAGSKLLLVDSTEESAWVSAALAGHGVGECWMGISDWEEEGNWKTWGGKAASWFDWGPGQPDNWGDWEDCAEFFTFGQWNDIGCEDINPVMCEDPCSWAEDQDGDSFLRCSSDCDDGNPDIHPGAAETCGDGVDNDCDGQVDNSPACTDIIDLLTTESARFFYIPVAVQRDEAESWCNEVDSTAGLVWFDSLEQLQAVFEALVSVASGTEVWIGLNDREQEGTYLWPDGSGPLFTNWAPNQPNNGLGSGEQDCCRSLADGTWNDTDCSLLYAPLCRADL